MGANAQIFTDSFNSDTVGSAPSGWSINLNGGTGTVTVQNVSSGTGTDVNSLYFYDADTSKRIQVGKTFTSSTITSGVNMAELSFSLMIASPAVQYTTFIIQLGDSSDAYRGGLQIQDSSGSGTLTIKNTGGISLGATISYDTWYKFKVDYMGLTSGSNVNIAVSNALTNAVVGNLTMTTSGDLANIQRILFLTGFGGGDGAKAYVNDISVAIVAIPEVSTGVMLGVGLLGLAGCGLLRRRICLVE